MERTKKKITDLNKKYTEYKNGELVDDWIIHDQNGMLLSYTFFV